MKTAALLLLLILTGGNICAQNKTLSGPPSERSDMNLFYAKGNNWYKFIFHDDSYLFKSNDEGKTWTRIFKGWPSIMWLDIKEMGDTLFLINSSETYYTLDHQNYYLYAQFINCDRYYSFSNSNTIIGFQDPGKLPAPVINNQTYNVSQVSFDMGKTWIDISKGLNSYENTYYDFASGRYKTENRFIAPQTTLLTNTGLLSVTYNPKNYEKKYQFLGIGSSGWIEVNNSNFNTLFKNKNLEFIFYDKQTKNAFLRTTDSSQLYSSPDEGITWKKAGIGLPDSINNTLQLFKKNDTLWAVVRLQISLDQAPNNLPYSTYNTNLIRTYFSTDNGINFTHVPHNIPKGISTQKTFVNPVNKQIYIVGNGAVYHQNPLNSQDFTPSISYFKGTAMYIDYNTRLISEAGNLYFRPFGRAYETDNGLYKSQDNGKTWKNLTANIPNKGVTDFLVRGDTIIMLTPLAHISFDGGNSWTKLTLPGIEFELIRNIGGEYYLIGDYKSERAVYTSADLLNWTFKQKLTIPASDHYQAINLFEINGNVLISTGYFTGMASSTVYISKDTLKTFNIINKNNSIDMTFSGQDFFKGQSFSLYPQTESCRVSYNNGESWSDTSIVNLKDALAICRTKDGRVFATFKNSLKELNPLNFNVIKTYSSAGDELGTFLTYSNGYITTTSRLKHGLLSFEVGQKVNDNKVETGIFNISVYPNPGNTFITVKANETNIKGTISLTDLNGKELNCTRFDGLATIDLAHIKSGIYIITVRTETEIYHSRINVSH